MDFAGDGQHYDESAGAMKWIVGLILLSVLGGVGYFTLSRPEEDEIALEEEVPLLSENGEPVAGAPKGRRATPYKDRYGKIGILMDESVRAIKSAHIKVHRLMAVEIENERLKMENAKLKEVVVSNQFKLETEEGVAHNKTVSSRIVEEAWTKTGRTPEQIVYQPPTQMTAAQLHTLGVTYFNAREDEKAAVIFSKLADSQDLLGYKSPKTLVLAGIAWYRLDNLRKADEYFERALKTEETPEELPYFAQARMWRGMVYERVGRHQFAQKFFHEVLDQHPQSPEAAWINRKGRRGGKSRSVASDQGGGDATPEAATERASQ